MLTRLVTGCSWATEERLLGNKVSDTTMRARRDEWIEAGVFEDLETEAVEAYDRIVGPDLAEACVDGSMHKAPCGGERTGKNPVDRGKLGFKWSLLTDRRRTHRPPQPLGPNPLNNPRTLLVSRSRVFKGNLKLILRVIPDVRLELVPLFGK